MSLLEGRLIVVAGAAGGLGAEIVRLFAAEGARVVAADIATEEAFRDALGEELPAVGYRRLDLTDAEAVTDLFEAAAGLDGFVNCTGIREVQPALELTLDEWRRVLDVNLTGTFLACQAAGRAMKREGTEGALVTMTSVSGMVGVAARAAYSASKAGVIGLMRNLAVEFAEFGVRVNTIAPGQIRTPLTEPYWQDESFREGLAETIPLGRGGEPADVATVALFLVSDLSRYMTGTVLPVDGGWVIYKSFALPGAASEAYLRRQRTDE